jgi:nickel transport protein
MLKTIFLLLSLVLVCVQQALPHDAWLAPHEGGLIVAYGHGEKLDPYDPETVKDVKALDCKGRAVPVEIARGKGVVSISSEEKSSTVTALFDGGYGVKTTDGWKKTTKRDAHGKYTVLEALKSRKYVKTLLSPCDAPFRFVGLPFEMAPQKDPFTVKPGEALPIKLLLDGKPLECAAIKDGRSESKETVKSDKDGLVRVLIQQRGLQIICASYKAPLKNDPDADVLSLSTSLTFEVR